MQGASVINCLPETESIEKAIFRALSPEFRALAAGAENPYGDGNTSSKIAEIIHDQLVHEKLNLKKKFYDLEFDDQL